MNFTDCSRDSCVDSSTVLNLVHLWGIDVLDMGIGLSTCMTSENIIFGLKEKERNFRYIFISFFSKVHILTFMYKWLCVLCFFFNKHFLFLDRSYYKCTSAGCSVRKHVERASHNLKYVITTYEGKHNHEVPAARNSNTMNSGGGSLSQITTNTQPALALARNTGPKPETQIQDFVPGFNRKPVFNNDYLRPSFAGNFSNGMKLGASTIYPLKYPTFQHTMPYGPFEINRSATHHSGSIASLVPDFPISLPSSINASVGLSLAGADFNYNGKPIGQSQALLSGQQMVKPKQEQRDDNLYDAEQSIIDHVNASPSSSSVYQRMRNFPS